LSAAAVDALQGREAAAPVTRMGIAVLSLAGLFIATYLLLHRLGVVGTLACGADGGCAVVQSSRWAVFLGVPVPAWGVGGYALLLGAALAGVQPGLADDRRVAGVLLALSSAAFLFSAYLTALEAFVIHAWCRWCLASAGVATAIFLLSLPEVRRLRRG
jgi:uncharacterized membrane protein